MKLSKLPNFRFAVRFSWSITRVHASVHANSLSPTACLIRYHHVYHVSLLTHVSQVWYEDTCQCGCARTDSAAKHYCALDANRQWDDETCSCVCKVSRDDENSRVKSQAA